MKVFTIGRDSDNNIVINDSKVSRHHLQIIQDDRGNFRLSDFGSTNGTYVNGNKISGEININQNDEICIGDTKLDWKNYFSYIPEKSVTNNNFHEKNISVGRDSSNDVVINDSKVSRNHLTMSMNNSGQVFLTDLNTSNGTFVNGKKIYSQVKLNPNDIVRIGDTNFTWQKYFNLCASNSKKKNLFALLGFIIALVSIAFFWIPVFGILLAVTGLIFSIIGIIKKSKKIFAIIGLIISGIMIIVSIICTFYFLPGIEPDINPYVPEYDGGDEADYYSETDYSALVAPKIQFHLTEKTNNTWDDVFSSYSDTDEENMKKLVAACDYDNTELRGQAVKLAGKSQGEFNLGQICEIFNYCFGGWKYVNDPVSREYFAKASESLKSDLSGDCDDYAILMCSMILAVGGEARINFAYGDEGGHAFTEVNIGYTDEQEVIGYLEARYPKVNYNDKIHCRTDSKGNRWLNLDWQAKHPGGNYFKYNNGVTFYIIQKFSVKM
ncbi:MAG: FHA domain-containing protein [Bacteroidales bacterium]|jgi:pSer/pThr/pTyr-binding forkhead associated (FHA) protein|nr:FHA domain-containing protein [Bacteroidales bacterium]